MLAFAFLFVNSVSAFAAEFTTAEAVQADAAAEETVAETETEVTEETAAETETEEN